MREMMKRSVLASMCAVCCAGIASPAMAQDATSETPAPTRASDTVELERVVATAQKRSESVSEVPAGISVIGEDHLEKMGAAQLTDFAALVPGFQVDSGGAPGRTALAMRGIAPLGSSASIGTYIDDTPLGASGNSMRSTSYSLDLLPYDIESIEILRGPQGTLYGASSMGGLFKYITKSADPNAFEMRAGAEVSAVDGASDLGTGVRMGFNVPLVEGRIGLRASFARKETPGYIDNAITGAEDQNDYEQLASRLALFWQLSDNATLRLQGMWQRVASANNGYVALDPLGQAPLYGDKINNNYIQEPYRTELEYYSATLDWDLGWADFVSATSYSVNQMVQTTDATAVYGSIFEPQFDIPNGLADFALDLELKKWTQEFRLVSKPSNRFEWLVGAFLTDEKGANTQLLNGYDLQGVLIPELIPLAVAGLPNTFEEQALFADATWKFSSRFDVSLGLRVARNDQDFGQITDGAFFGGVYTFTPGESSETVTTYKLASRWHLGENSMFYARLATGYRPGGPNLAWPGVPPMVNSDTLVNHELGWKSHFLSGRAMVDIAAFQIDWEDMQVGVSDAGVGYLANGGGARSRGIELSTLIRPTEGLTLGLSAAYIDSELDENVPESSGLVAGSRMPMTPELSWSTTAEYGFQLGHGWDMRFGGAFRSVGDRIGLQGFEIKSYHALDLHADISNHKWTARLYVRNATNEDAYMSMSPVISALGGTAHVNGILLQPRTVGFSVDYRY